MNSFSMLNGYIIDSLHKVVTDREGKKNKQGSAEQVTSDFYFSGMDESTINKLGVMPLESELSYIQSINQISELEPVIAHLHSIGVNTIFSFGSMSSLKDRTKIIGSLGRGDLTLPDRDYYLKNENPFKKIRVTIMQYMIRMLELSGDDHSKAVTAVNTIMNIETRLAQATLSQIEWHNPKVRYPTYTIHQLQKIAPHFSWGSYFYDMSVSDIKSVNVQELKIMKTMDKLLQTISLDDWKIYLRWCLIQKYSSYLSTPYTDLKFRMRAAVYGIKKPRLRWREVMYTEFDMLSSAIGELYTKNHFAVDVNQVFNIAKKIKEEFNQELQESTWLEASTRKAALKKLQKMKIHVGNSNHTSNYAYLGVDKGPYVLNIIRINKVKIKRNLRRIGLLVNKNVGDKSSQIPNACYNSMLNSITIPLGIIQSPNFDENAPESVKFGAIGSIIAHEMTHGFGKTGRQFNEDGNFHDEWSSVDLKKWQFKMDCVSSQFSHYISIDNLYVQGDLVVNEAMADLGGLMLAYRAFHASDAYQYAKTINGLTPDQQFFIGFAHTKIALSSSELAFFLSLTDPHPPEMYRVNGTLANMPEFQRAFNLSDDSPMVNKNRCVVW